MSIKVSIRSVYGNDLIYPVCEVAKVFASLIGKKTLTYAAITDIKKLGYSVQVVQANETL